MDTNVHSSRVLEAITGNARNNNHELLGLIVNDEGGLGYNRND